VLFRSRGERKRKEKENGKWKKEKEKEGRERKRRGRWRDSRRNRGARSATRGVGHECTVGHDTRAEGEQCDGFRCRGRVFRRLGDQAGKWFELNDEKLFKPFYRVNYFGGFWDVTRSWSANS